MHSGVFANTPRDAGRLLRRMWVENLPSHRTEVMDIDEDAVRAGTISASLYGYMLTPMDADLMQPFKLALGGGGEEDHKEAIAKFFVDSMHPGMLYILGPGTTIEAVGHRLGIAKTLLGVDLVADRQLVGKDVDEDTILHVLSTYPRCAHRGVPNRGSGFSSSDGGISRSPIG